MIDWLIDIDKSAMVALNALHSPLLDPVMVFFSNKWVWAPLYALLIYILYRRFAMKAWWLILALVAVIAVADRLTSGVMKPAFARYRPCHDTEMAAKIHVVDGCGGRYGFPSSHAANTFALAAFFCFLFRWQRRYRWLVLWAATVSYSRIYLGVHYPMDVVVGSLVGWGIGAVAVLVLRPTLLTKN